MSGKPTALRPPGGRRRASWPRLARVSPDHRAGPPAVNRRHLLATFLAALATGAAGARPARASGELARQAGQLLIVGFAGTRAGDPGVEAVRGQIAAGQLGGVLLLDRNIESPPQLARLTRHLADVGPALPPLVAIDQEGGAVRRLTPEKGFLPWQSPRTVAGRLGEAEAEAYYLARARELAAAGITLNLAPVVDLDHGRASPVIGALGRAYGPDPETVSAMARAFVRAHRRAGVLTSLKHFPGHGSARSDSHRELPDISAVWEPAETEPYRWLAEDGMVDSAMVGHLYHPAFSERAGLPASLSPRAHREMRALMGRRAPIITDDLQMEAVMRRWTEAEATVAAVAAGSDLVIVSTFRRPDRGMAPRLHRALLDAVRDGRLPAARLREAYLRVIAAKQRVG